MAVRRLGRAGRGRDGLRVPADRQPTDDDGDRDRLAHQPRDPFVPVSRQQHRTPAGTARVTMSPITCSCASA